MSRKLPLLVIALLALLGLQILPALAQGAAPVPDVLTMPDQIAGGRRRDDHRRRNAVR